MGHSCNNTIEELNWELYPNMVSVKTIGDGNCFFHSVIYAFSAEYKRSDHIQRINIIRSIRKELSEKLPEYYDKLSRGNLLEFSKIVFEYTLENMCAVLKGNIPVDNVYNEYVSDVFNIDIYLLDYVNRNVYITGNDTDILYKNRPSVVIGVLPGHYELVGIKLDDEKVKTLFEPNDDFIKTIRESMKNKGIIFCGL